MAVRPAAQTRASGPAGPTGHLPAGPAGLRKAPTVGPELATGSPQETPSHRKASTAGSPRRARGRRAPKPGQPMPEAGNANGPNANGANANRPNANDANADNANANGPNAGKAANDPGSWSAAGGKGPAAAAGAATPGPQSPWPRPTRWRAGRRWNSNRGLPRAARRYGPANGSRRRGATGSNVRETTGAWRSRAWRRLAARIGACPTRPPDRSASRGRSASRAKRTGWSCSRNTAAHAASRSCWARAPKTRSTTWCRPCGATWSRGYRRQGHVLAADPQGPGRSRRRATLRGTRRAARDSGMTVERKDEGMKG